MIEKTNIASRGSKGDHHSLQLSMTEFGGCKTGRTRLPSTKLFRNGVSDTFLNSESQCAREFYSP